MATKRMISFLLALTMMLGIFANPVFATSSRPKEGKEVNYEIQKIDGKSYKAYKISDLGLKHPEKLIAPKYRVRAAGDPMEDWVKVRVESHTTGLTLGGDFDLDVFVALRKDDTKIAKAKINPTEPIVKNQVYHFVKTDAYDENNPDHQDPDKWYLIVPRDFRYDVRIYVQDGGSFTRETIYLIVGQRAMPLYKAVWFTNNQERPVVDALYNDGDNRPNNVKLNNTDFGKNEYKSVSDAPGDLYVGKTLAEVKNENRGTVPRENFLISDMKGAVLWKLEIEQDGVKKTKGTIKDGDTKYHFNITGDYKTPFVAEMRQELNVKFDPNGATFDQDVKTEQPIGHSMKIGEAFGDLEAVTVPTKDQISNIPKKDNKDQVLVGWVVDKDNKDLDFSNGKNKDKLVDPKGYEVKNNVTFYAVYAPKDQGDFKVVYKDTANNKVLAEETLEGNKDEAVDASKIDLTKKFVGYERTTKSVDVTGKTYKKVEAGQEDQLDKVVIEYKKLDDVIPEKDPNGGEDRKKPEGYVTVTYVADKNIGDLLVGGKKSTEGSLNYFVNPNAGIAIKNVTKDPEKVTAQVNDDKKDIYKLDETKEWNFTPSEIDDDTVIVTADVTLTANFVKEKGTVTYKYNANVNNTEVQNPDTSGIPKEPTDATEYEAGTKVKAETTVAPKEKKVEVKKDGTLIGYWKFSGWTPEELEVKKNSEKSKNEFTGTWTFEEVGKEKVTYKFVSGTEGKALPTEGMPTLPPEVQKYVGATVAKPADPDTKTIEVKQTINDKEVVVGKWTFEGWSPESLKVDDKKANEFVGTWNFTKSPKGHLVYNFTSQDGTLPKEVTDLTPTDKKENYVGVVVKPEALTQKSVDGKNGDKEGTWSTEWTPSDVTLAEGENNVDIPWTFAEKAKKDVTYKFKYVQEGKELTEKPAEITTEVPGALTDQYVGKTVNAPKAYTDKFDQELGGKKGTWTFDNWDKESLVVDADANKNVFTGTWTWTEKDKIEVKYVFDKPADKKLPADLLALKPEDLTKDKKVYLEDAPGLPDLPDLSKDPAKSARIVKDDNGDKVGTWSFDGGWVKSVDKDKNITYTLKWTIIPADKSSVPNINPVKPDDKTITGTGTSTPESTVKVTIPGVKDPIPAKVDKDGNWKVDVPDNIHLKDGDVITATQKTGDLQESGPAEVTVQRERKGGFFFFPAADEEKPETGIHKAYIFGYEDDSFKPEGNMTRAEAAAMLARLQGLDLSNDARPDFMDVRSGWYNGSINAVVNAGYMKGYPDNTFRPNGKITRAEFAQMIKAIDKENTGVAPFADVKGHWAEAAINQAFSNGRIAGYPDGTFRPNNNITRAEAVTVFNKLYDRSVDEAGLANVQKGLVDFTDINRGHWAYDQVVEASNTHEYYRTKKGEVAETWVKIIQTWKDILAHR